MNLHSRRIKTVLIGALKKNKISAIPPPYQTKCWNKKRRGKQYTTIYINNELSEEKKALLFQVGSEKLRGVIQAPLQQVGEA